MGDDLREVVRQLRGAQEKQTYFLLTAAGAAIALVVKQTQEASLSWSQLPLGAAVFCWGLSFFLGCRHLAYVCSNLYANAELLKVEGGFHEEVGSNPQIMMAASAGIREAIATNSDRANYLGHWQFRVLILGAILYLVWHLLEMWIRTS